MRRIFFPLPFIALAALPAQAADAEQLEAGQELYDVLCVACHGEDGKGVKGAGSDIRDSIVRQVKMATGGGYEDMPEVELTEDEIKAIVAYLNSL